MEPPIPQPDATLKFLLIPAKIPTIIHMNIPITSNVSKGFTSSFIMKLPTLLSVI